MKIKTKSLAEQNVSLSKGLLASIAFVVLAALAIQGYLNFKENNALFCFQLRGEKIKVSGMKKNVIGTVVQTKMVNDVCNTVVVWHTESGMEVISDQGVDLGEIQKVYQ